MTKPAKLALEDGTIFSGVSFGAEGEVDGEVCFNTSMTGYQEILTDPSYRGQIVTMTYPEIGNYGINGEDLESARPHLAGFVVRQRARRASNFRSSGSLEDYLKQWNVVGLAGIDTRALVRHIRNRGAMKGVLSSIDLDDERLVEKARRSPGLVGRDLVREVIPDQPRDWQERLSPWATLPGIADVGRSACSGLHCADPRASPERMFGPHVVAMDYGMKSGTSPGIWPTWAAALTILPGTASADDILGSAARRRAFLSNGPGDPEPLDYAIQRDSRRARSRVPVFRHLPRASASCRWPAAPRHSNSSSAIGARTIRC